MFGVEVEPKGQDVFTGLGLLILEGRLPGITTRGYGEGPHCVTSFQNQKGHTCLPDTVLCSRNKSFKKHAALLWKNGIPLGIEVLLCSTCHCSMEKCFSPEISPLPDPSSVLLEQWTISAGVRGTEVPGIRTETNLLQAVRSYLHFSQLAAWLSLSKGEEPKCIILRVTIPGEDFGFGSRFPGGIQEHDFPMAQMKEHIIKVNVKSLPRSEQIPTILCSKASCCVRGGSGKSMSLLIEDFKNSSVRDGKRGSSEVTGPQAVPTCSTLDDRLPSSCTSPGKHNCGQHDEDLYCSSLFGATRKEVHLIETEGFPYVKPSSWPASSGPSSMALDSSSPSSSSTLQVEVEPEPEEPKSSSRNSSPGPGTTSDEDSESGRSSRERSVPTFHEKVKFRKSLHSAASMVFHGKSGLPLTSSPAPFRKGQRFDFDASLVSPAHIKSAIKKSQNMQQRCSEPSQSLLGCFEESVLNGRLEPVSTVEGFSAEIGASGEFNPEHVHLPVTVFFYKFCDNDKVSTPYLAHVNLGQKGYLVPRKGTIQVNLSNPQKTVVKMFVVRYDFEDMPPGSQTFLRQRILNMPTHESVSHPDALKWIRFLIHLRFASSRSGKIYLHTDLRIVVYQKSDADTASSHGLTEHELRSVTNVPRNPKYSPKIKMMGKSRARVSS